MGGRFEETRGGGGATTSDDVDSTLPTAAVAQDRDGRGTTSSGRFYVGDGGDSGEGDSDDERGFDHDGDQDDDVFFDDDGDHAEDAFEDEREEGGEGGEGDDGDVAGGGESRRARTGSRVGEIGKGLRRYNREREDCSASVRVYAAANLFASPRFVGTLGVDERFSILFGVVSYFSRVSPSI